MDTTEAFLEWLVGAGALDEPTVGVADATGADDDVDVAADGDKVAGAKGVVVVIGAEDKVTGAEVELWTEEGEWGVVGKPLQQLGE